MRRKGNCGNIRKKVIASCSMVCIIICGFAGIVATLNCETNNIEKVSKEMEVVKAITISAGTKNRENYTPVESEDHIEVPVPKGYVASPDVEERYVNGVTTDGVREHHGGVCNL